jgi:hypothetical protein
MDTLCCLSDLCAEDYHRHACTVPSHMLLLLLLQLAPLNMQGVTSTMRLTQYGTTPPSQLPWS